MSMSKLTGQSFCSICAHDITSAKCPHPWHKPFEEWPKGLLGPLKEMLPNEPHEGS